MNGFKPPDSVRLFSEIKKMSFRQFDTWLTQYGFECFQTGLHEGEKEGVWWADTQIFDLLRSEKIGEDRANRIIKKLLEGAEN